jgi:predicted DNA-binding protein
MMQRVSFFLSPELAAGLDALQQKHGTPKAESIRRAIEAYLRDQGALKAPANTPRKAKGGAR